MNKITALGKTALGKTVLARKDKPPEVQVRLLIRHLCLRVSAFSSSLLDFRNNLSVFNIFCDDRDFIYIF